MCKTVWRLQKASGADFIVALGGGSSIDTAKGIGIVVNNPDFADVKSLEGVADTKHKACTYLCTAYYCRNGCRGNYQLCDY